MKKKKRATAKTPTKSYLTKKLDQACSLITRSKGRCVKCGEQRYQQLQCCHIYSRTYKSVRWDLLNLLCMCASCHRWGHNNPCLFTEFVQTYLGAEQYEELKARAEPTSHWKIHEMQELREANESAMKRLGVWYRK